MHRATILIPARLGSTRLPRKLMLDLNGKTVIQRTVEGCQRLDNVRVVVLTEDQEIYDHVSPYCECLITKKCSSGTERILTAIDDIDGIILNVQADEPLVHPRDLDRMIDLLKENTGYIYTLDRDLYESDYKDRNHVKLYKEEWDEVFLFTRSPIYKNIMGMGKHIGIYGFNKEILLKISNMEPSLNAVAESLEQLTWIDNGLRILSLSTWSKYISIDSEDDYKKAKIYLKRNYEKN